MSSLLAVSDRAVVGAAVAGRAAVRAAWVALWVSFVAVGAAALCLNLPSLFGRELLTVLSGSMAPTIHTGDVVVERSISPLEAHLGEVVTFRDPTRNHVLITHRIREIEVIDAGVRFRTRGDANTVGETWVIEPDGRIGLVEYTIPKLGHAIESAHGPYGRLALIVVPALLIGSLVLQRIWQAPERRSSS